MKREDSGTRFRFGPGGAEGVKARAGVGMIITEPVTQWLQAVISTPTASVGTKSAE